MGLFGSDTYYCTVCGTEADDSNAEQCTQCGSVTHHKCFKDTSNAKVEDNLITSDDVVLRCPDCGHVGEV